MSRPVRLALATLALTLGPVLAACGSTGFNADATKDYSPADGTLGTVGDLRVLNSLVVAPPEAGGTPVISMSVANRGSSPDQLQQVTVNGGAPATVLGPTEVPAGGSITVGGPDSESQVLLEGTTVTPGGAAQVTLRFADAGSLTIDTVVVSPTGIYAGYVAPPLQGDMPTVSPSVPATPAPTTNPEPGTTPPAPAESTPAAPVPTSTPTIAPTP